MSLDERALRAMAVENTGHPEDTEAVIRERETIAEILRQQDKPG